MRGTSLLRLLPFSVCSLAAGCGSPYPATVPVTGVVTFDGGACPAAGTVFFTPVEASNDVPMRPGVADFGVDGKFAVRSYEEGDGLVPGKYLVRIECWETPPNMEGKPVKSHVPSKYHDASTSGLELVVEPGDAAKDLTYDIPLRK